MLARMPLARMSLRVAAVVLALPLLARASADEAAAPAPQTPLEVAQRYAELVRDGEAGQAIDQYWNLDVMLESAFGESLQRHTEAERTEIKRLLRDFMQRINGDPRVTKHLQQTSLEGFRAKEREGTPRTATVNYTVVLGKKRALNTVLLQQLGERWVIVDCGAVGKLIGPAMKSDYARQSQLYSPLQFIRQMASTRQVR